MLIFLCNEYCGMNFIYLLTLFFQPRSSSNTYTVESNTCQTFQLLSLVNVMIVYKVIGTMPSLEPKGTRSGNDHNNVLIIGLSVNWRLVSEN